MFTGIIEAIGVVKSINPKDGDYQLQVATGKLDLSDVNLGDSIAVNGVCLTVVRQESTGFFADVSKETVNHTAFSQLKPGSNVNLERALTLQTRLGGHMVSGHVDGIGTILTREEDARSIRFRIKCDDSLAKYIAHKGSITIDGTSLTVNAVDGATFELNIVPHTLQETIMGSYIPGSIINLEVDIIARYLERLLMGDNAAKSTSDSNGIDISFLAENGFMR